ncbi:MAG: hypothetical protein ACTHMG_14940 [Sphingomonas sp.]
MRIVLRQYREEEGRRPPPPGRGRQRRLGWLFRIIAIVPVWLLLASPHLVTSPATGSAAALITLPAATPLAPATTEPVVLPEPVPAVAPGVPPDRWQKAQRRHERHRYAARPRIPHRGSPSAASDAYPGDVPDAWVSGGASPQKPERHQPETVIVATNDASTSRSDDLVGVAASGHAPPASRLDEERRHAGDATMALRLR